MTPKKTHPLRLFLLAYLLVLSSADFVDIVTSIYSISTVIDSADDKYRTVSLEGGAYLYIKGAGFSTRSPLSNKVTVGDNDCPIIEFLTTSTQIVCQVPPVRYDQTAQVIVNSDDFRTASCAKCYLSYSYIYTPQLQYMLPNAGNPGQEIYYYGKQRVASSLDVDYVKIGDYRCDPSDQNEFNAVTFTPDNNARAPCNVPDIEAGYYNVTQRNLGNTGFAKKLQTVPVYRLDGEAYDFAVVPKITSISNSQGSSEGQIITIEGAGFSTTQNNEVNLASAPCKIIKQSSTEIECELQPLAGEITNQGYHSGWKFEAYKGKDIDSIRSGSAGTPTSEAVKLSSEFLFSGDATYSTKLYGYFKAPVTGNYKFIVTAEDKAQLYMSKTPLDKQNLELVVDLKSAVPYKFFSSRSTVSDPIALNADEFYYMELYHTQSPGSGFATLGVQVMNITNDVNNLPEIQAVKINCPTDLELLELKMTNAVGGTWKIRVDFLSSDRKRIEKTLYSTSIPIGAPATTIAAQIYSLMPIKTTVTRQMLASDGSETTQVSEARTIRYEVVFLSTRTNGRLPIIESSDLQGSEIAVSVQQLRAPSPPVSGTFSLFRNGKTIDLKSTTTAEDFELKLRGLGFVDSIRVVQVGDIKFSPYWIIQFTGNGAEPIEPLVATHSLTGCNNPSAITVDVLTLQDNSQDLFYEVIPFSYLFTADQKSQITVKSNGITGNCPGFNCDYVIKETGLPQVISSSYSNPTLTASIDQVSTGDYTKDDIGLFFGNTECQVSTYSDSSPPVIITADCPTPEAGNYHPKIHFNGLGYAKIDPSLSKITVDAIISSVTPNQINPNGGSVLKVTGSGFPASLEVAQQREFKVTIGSALCKLESISPTQFECITEAVIAEAPLSVTFNEKTATSPNNLSLLSVIPKITSVTPSSVSPVLQTDLTITGSNLDVNFASTKVYLSTPQNPRVTECLPFFSSTSEIKCKLLGAPTRMYQLFVKTSVGNTNSLSFEAKTIITSISPSSGSAAGGTILTIQGGTFSDDIQQTLIFIGDENTPCDVISSTPSQVQCKTRAKDASYDQTPKKVVVATRIVEESHCADGATCEFSYLDSLTPVVSAINVTSFAPGSNLQITGSGFTSALQAVYLM